MHGLERARADGRLSRLTLLCCRRTLLSAQRKLARSFTTGGLTSGLRRVEHNASPPAAALSAAGSETAGGALGWERQQAQASEQI